MIEGSKVPRGGVQMGLSTAGIAFRSTIPTMTYDEIVSHLFGPGYQRHVNQRPVQWEDRFDIRKTGDVAIEIKGEVCFVYSSDLVQPDFFEGTHDCTQMWRVLEQPSSMTGFCHFDSGAAYGYVIFENGMKIRRRIDVGARTVDEGSQRNFEIQTVREWAENGNTSVMLRCVLITWSYQNEPPCYRRASV
jgi:hypothetical protein